MVSGHRGDGRSEPVSEGEMADPGSSSASDSALTERPLNPQSDRASKTSRAGKGCAITYLKNAILAFWIIVVSVEAHAVFFTLTDSTQLPPGFLNGFSYPSLQNLANNTLGPRCAGTRKETPCDAC